MQTSHKSKVYKRATSQPRGHDLERTFYGEPHLFYGAPQPRCERLTGILFTSRKKTRSRVWNSLSPGKAFNGGRGKDKSIKEAIRQRKYRHEERNTPAVEACRLVLQRTINPDRSNRIFIPIRLYEFKGSRSGCSRKNGGAKERPMMSASPRSLPRYDVADG
jgi:hypothetical protein